MYCLSFAIDQTGKPFCVSKNFAEKLNAAVKGGIDRLYPNTALVYADNSQLTHDYPKKLQLYVKAKALGQNVETFTNDFSMATLNVSSDGYIAALKGFLEEYAVAPMQQTINLGCPMNMIQDANDSSLYSAENVECHSRSTAYPIWMGAEMNGSDDALLTTIGWMDPETVNRFFTVELVQIGTEIRACIASPEEGKHFHLSHKVGEGQSLKWNNVSFRLKHFASNSAVHSSNFEKILIDR